jgi:hypothetical protein
MTTLSPFVHLISISGVIVALVMPGTEGSMAKVKVPGVCDTAQVVMTIPFTLPAGIEATIEPPPAATQLMVSVIG